MIILDNKTPGAFFVIVSGALFVMITEPMARSIFDDIAKIIEVRKTRSSSRLFLLDEAEAFH